MRGRTHRDIMKLDVEMLAFHINLLPYRNTLWMGDADSRLYITTLKHG
jgi:hypothetical protein